MTTTYAATRTEASPKVSSAWTPFIGSLATVLGQLQEDQFLILSAKGSNRFVQFYAQGAFGMRAEAVSNEYLRGKDRLEVAQIARLGELGWLSPSGNSRTSTPQNDPDGSPNHYINIAAPVPFGDVSALAVRTLREVMAVAHPQFLEYSALDTRGNILEFGELGLLRAAANDRRAYLERRVLKTLHALTGLEDLEFNEKGIVGLRYGSSAILVRATQDLSAVFVDSPLLVGVESSNALLAELNALNGGESRMRFLFDEETVTARCDVAIEAFLPSIFGQILETFCEQTQAVTELLQASYGGRPVLATDAVLRPTPPLSKMRH